MDHSSGLVFRRPQATLTADLWSIFAPPFSDGTGAAEGLLADTNVGVPWTWSADGRLIFGDEGGRRISMLTIEGDPSRDLLFETEFNQAFMAISPDGRWTAYMSDESGQNEVYVLPFPSLDDGRWQVSTSGGGSPVWSPTGRELFYRGPGTLMVAPIEPEPTFTSGTPEFLLSTRGYANRRGRFYDISPDGRLFLLTKNAADTSTPAQIVVIQNWFEELKERVPAN